MRLYASELKFLMGLILALVLAPAYAQQEETTEPAAWKESAIQFPAAPEKENLLPFSASISNTLNFTIDAKSVTVENDGVVRYTLVITSKTGASNISYEGSWSAAKRGGWDPIPNGGINRQHITLAKEYFCDGTRTAGNAATIVERIRRKKPLK